MLVLILGASGFVGRNLSCFLQGQPHFKVHELSRVKSDIVRGSQYDAIINCVGVNRSDDKELFSDGNVNFIDWFFNSHAASENISFKRVIHLSSSKAGDNSVYGKTKLHGERILEAICKEVTTPVKILRYVNLFGKWSKPDYNSVVATWCRDYRLSLTPFVSDPETRMELIYIDDLCAEVRDLILLSEADFAIKCEDYNSDATHFSTRLQDLQSSLKSISDSVKTVRLFSPSCQLEKHLYSTYISFLDPRDTVFQLSGHGDGRGQFFEVFKLGASGQVSVSSTFPTSEARGNHFHMSKVEVFCLVSGTATMRHKEWGGDEVIITKLNTFDCITTIPGYVHDIQNTSDQPLLLLIWANEEFEREAPDTYQSSI